jgi:Reverse gyrase
MASDALNKLTTGKAGPYFGFLLALLIGISFAYLGLYTLLCGFGGALICAILLYMIPKSMGANIKHLAVFGVIFLVAVSAFSAYAISKPFIEDAEGVHKYKTFSDVSVEPFNDDGPYVFSVTHTLTGTEIIELEYNTSRMVQQRGLVRGSGDNTVVSADAVSLTTHTFTVPDLADNGVFYYKFVVRDGIGGDVVREGGVFIGPVTMDDSQLIMFCFTGNLYYVGVNIVMFFFLIVLITTWMRSNLEKTRARLEAEGRLYPQGYGRCKECGTIILPGEVVCRKCGAYIDVPDEIKVKKVEYFECSDCGKEVPLSSDKCPFCGAAFEDDIEDETVAEAEKGPKNEVTFTCSECGKQVPESASVCPHCGEKFEDML